MCQVAGQGACAHLQATSAGAVIGCWLVSPCCSLVSPQSFHDSLIFHCLGGGIPGGGPIPGGRMPGGGIPGGGIPRPIIGGGIPGAPCGGYCTGGACIRGCIEPG